MGKITFGTDGWRSIVADNFINNLKTICGGIGTWLHNQYPGQEYKVVLGNDCRFMGEFFIELISQELACYNIKIIRPQNPFISTPILSLMTKHHKAALGIMVTASHNPYIYSGIKLKSPEGGPLDEALVKEIETLANVQPESPRGPQQTDVLCKNGIFEDYEATYLKCIKRFFDTDFLKRYSKNVVYDAMFGAGQAVAQKLLPQATFLRSEPRADFNKITPEPIESNLRGLQKHVLSEGGKVGFATDGDADRLALFDEMGNYVDSSRIIMLVIMYLCEYKDLKPNVISTFSCSDKIHALCRYYKLTHTVTKIGFKHISPLMLQNPNKLSLGGEESGGIAISHFLPERDGVFIMLTLLELIHSAKQPLSSLVTKLCRLVGSSSCQRLDLKIKEGKKMTQVLADLPRQWNKVLSKEVMKIEELDGTKIRFVDGSWVMLRSSGTEPLVRVYAEASEASETLALLEAARQLLTV